MTCSDGSLDSANQIECPENTCDAFSTTASGNAAGTVAGSCTEGGATSAPECAFECDDGYLLSGTSSPITCGLDGAWPTPYPHCAGTVRNVHTHQRTHMLSLSETRNMRLRMQAAHRGRNHACNKRSSGSTSRSFGGETVYLYTDACNHLQSVLPLTVHYIA